MSLGPDTAGGLLGLSQGGQTVADYAIDFHTWACQSDWNVVAQCDVFMLGLGDYVKDDLPSLLDGLIELVSRVD